MVKQPSFRRLFCVMMLGWVFLTLGCGLTSVTLLPTSTPEPSQTPSPLPTFTPLPSATPTSTPVPEVRIADADWYALVGDYAKAYETYQMAFMQAGDDQTRAAALMGIGYVNFLTGKYPEAIDAFNNLLDVYPQSTSLSRAYYYLAQSFAAIQAFPEATAAYQKLIEKNNNPINDFFYELLGDIRTSEGDMKGALESYQAALSASPVGNEMNIQMKIGKTYAALADYENAVRMYLDIYQRTEDEYAKAQMNLLAGQAYIQLGVMDQAYARFQDSVNNYPMAYDTYSGLAALIDAGEPVDDLNSALVYYYAGQYGLATDILQRILNSGAEHDGTPHHYLAQIMIIMGDIEGAIAQWESLINDHTGDRFWVQAWDEKAYTLWIYLGRYEDAVQTYLGFVNRVPTDPEAPSYLYRAARIFEQHNDLGKAAELWERLIIDYPAHELSFRGLFLAGVCYYRLEDFEKARATFQRLLLLSSDLETQAGAQLWIGKIAERKGNPLGAREAWQQAADLDPTGYYSERANELLQGIGPMETLAMVNLEYNLEEERSLADAWFRSVFAIPLETDLSSLGNLLENPHIQRGNAFWELSLYPQAGAEFDNAREEIAQDAVSNFRLLTHMVRLGFNRQAILLSRQVLDLAHFDDASTLLAPVYFNHLRFGTFFKDLVMSAASEIGLEPLVLFSLIRQESFFEWYAGSSAGALGLMQLIPSTGQDMASYLGWPEGYSEDDLFLPGINIRLGAQYLKRQRELFGTGNIYAILAAYNAGPSNALNWFNIAGDDPDLFLEVVRFSETRNYIMYIYESMHIYLKIYSAVK